MALPSPTRLARLLLTVLFAVVLGQMQTFRINADPRIESQPATCKAAPYSSPFRCVR